jgi:hypothetical protein
MADPAEGYESYMGAHPFCSVRQNSYSGGGPKPGERVLDVGCR